MTDFAEAIAATDATALVFTDTAALKVGELIREEGNPNLKLRVFVSGGGCSGFQYGFTFDRERGRRRHLRRDPRRQAAVDPMSFQYLAGAQIDYKEDLEGAQFVIRQPKRDDHLRLRFLVLGLMPVAKRPGPSLTSSLLSTSGRQLSHGGRALHARPAGDRRPPEGDGAARAGLDRRAGCPARPWTGRCSASSASASGCAT